MLLFHIEQLIDEATASNTIVGNIPVEQVQGL